MSGCAGWLVKPLRERRGRTILTPLTPLASGLDPTVLFGAPIVEVACYYRTADGKDLEVTVRYALPIDINPWNDFYVGCTALGRQQPVATQAKAWNNRDRVYRVVGANTWSLATFVDDLGELGTNDVPRFEAITNAMLRAAQPFAHDCKLAGSGGPVELTSLWSFSFDRRRRARELRAVPEQRLGHHHRNHAGERDRNDPRPPRHRLPPQAHRKGKTRWLTIHVGAPIEFQHSYGSLLRTQLSVTALERRRLQHRLDRHAAPLPPAANPATGRRADLWPCSTSTVKARSAPESKPCD